MQKPGHETKRIVDFYYLEQQMRIVTLKSLCCRCIFCEKWSRRLSQILKHGKMKLKQSISREIFRDNRKTNYDPSNKPCSEQQSPTQPKKRSQIILKINSRTFNLKRQQRSNRNVAAAVQRATWCNAGHTHTHAPTSAARLCEHAHCEHTGAMPQRVAVL